MASRIIILGPPGAGKGTQAAGLAKAKRIAHVSTGDMLRAAIAAGTPLGKQAKAYLEAGELVPDSLVIDMLLERLAERDAQAGWLLDGFPRNAAQAEALATALGEAGPEVVVNFDVDEETLVDRLMKRALEQGRVDDTREVILNRMRVYREQTQPLIDWYADRQGVVTVDGLGSVENVAARLRRAVGN